MKNFKKIINSMLVATTLAPIPMVVSACSSTTVATRKFSFINDYNDTARAQLGAATYKVSTSDFVVGQENKITITFDNYSEIAKVTSKKQYFEIYQTNSFGRTPGELVEGTDYTVENPSTHVFVIKFTADQSKKVTKDMTVRFKAYYKTVKVKVELPSGNNLADSLEDWWTYNNYVNYDYSFLAIPRHLECGFDVSDEVIEKAEIYGVKEDKKEEKITNVKFEKVLAYFKMQNTGDVAPSQSHYMKVTIPMSSLFTVDAKENFTAKYTSIRVKGDKACSWHKGTEFGNKFVLNPVNCQIQSRTYGWNKWTYQGKEEQGVRYEAKFIADSGKAFNFDYSTAKSKLPISSLRIQSRNELFKTIKIDNVTDLVSDFFIKDPNEWYFTNLLDKCPKLENWLEFEVSTTTTANDTLTVRIIIDKMCNFTQMPTLSVIDFEKLSQYSGGCIDFLDYLSMDVVAE